MFVSLSSHNTTLNVRLADALLLAGHLCSREYIKGPQAIPSESLGVLFRFARQTGT
jgi:hypothetical protein